MKYINLINEFWRLNAIEPFSSTDISVYFYLLNQCNLRHWENPFSVTTHQMEVALNITRKTIMASRNRLQKRGLLTILNRGKKPALLILANCDAPSEGQETTHCGKQEKEQSGNKPETNTTHIKREKNKEKRYIKKHSIECQKSERVPEKCERVPKECEAAEENCEAVPEKCEGVTEKYEAVEEQCEAVTEKYEAVEEKCEAVTERSDSARYVAFNDWVRENAPYVASHLKPLSQLEFDKLIGKFGPQCLARNIDNLENRSDLRRRYTSLYRTMLNWCVKDPLA